YETISDLAASHSDAYDLLTRLRPQWLRPRGSVSAQDPDAGYPVVYLDGTRYGRPELLRSLRTDDVQSIQYLGPTDASTRYGTGHVGGVILVTTRR
ncbi:MAG TPA: hypothetical protein VMN60_01930, partial [Longimicrobiales bacterium]|nr:hypothetical protein [Longimicrobiales bacterium]